MDYGGFDSSGASVKQHRAIKILLAGGFGVGKTVAINCFDGARRYDVEDVRMALDLDPELPIIQCDARSRESCKQVLITLVEHVLMTAPEEPVRHSVR
jgi:signal recognition particle receptor subunit beta